MATVFPDGCGFFQQDYAPCCTTKIAQEWFEEQEKKRYKVLTWHLNSPDLNPFEHLWGVVGKQVQSIEAPPSNLCDLKDL